MRNLRNTRYDRWKPPAQVEGRPLTAATWDLVNDSVLCTFGPTENDALIELLRVNVNSNSQYVLLKMYIHSSDNVLVNIQSSRLGMRLVQIRT